MCIRDQAADRHVGYRDRRADRAAGDECVQVSGQFEYVEARPVGSSTVWDLLRHHAETRLMSREAASAPRSRPGWQPKVGQPGSSQRCRTPVDAAPGMTSHPCAA